MSNVIHLDSRRSSRFDNIHPSVPDCDCAACDVRRLARIAEQLRDEAKTALLVDGCTISGQIDEIIHPPVLCGFECERPSPQHPESGA